ncbi:MAG: SGNH/GDSL hydrolase family protein [Clostridiales bacterium]|nr:SGNH/GDSL hydrolase family protein [Clostridiales bacterium]
MKKTLSVLCAAMCAFSAFALAACGGKPNNGTDDPPPAEEEGVLTISDVFQYCGYSPIKIETKMDGQPVDGLDLYYDIVDKTVCEIQNGYVNGLKAGSTEVYAQTLNGQEVMFEVTVHDAIAYKYNAVVLTREEDYINKANRAKNPTLFVGDSFFDERYCWKSFYDDFDGLNCFSVGISGSQTVDWYVAKTRLITAFEPKNIVVHIGTNDINDTSINMTVDGYYKKITAFLDMLLDEFPDTPIYYFGIEDRNGSAGGKNRYSSAVTEKIKTEFQTDNAYFHYLDTPSVFNADPDRYVSTDNIHPSVEGYRVYTEMLKQQVEF